MTENGYGLWALVVINSLLTLLTRVPRFVPRRHHAIEPIAWETGQR